MDFPDRFLKKILKYIIAHCVRCLSETMKKEGLNEKNFNVN